MTIIVTIIIIIIIIMFFIFYLHFPLSSSSFHLTFHTDSNKVPILSFSTLFSVRLQNKQTNEFRLIYLS